MLVFVGLVDRATHRAHGTMLIARLLPPPDIPLAVPLTPVACTVSLDSPQNPRHFAPTWVYLVVS